MRERHLPRDSSAPCVLSLDGPPPVTRLAAEPALDRSRMGRNLNLLESANPDCFRPNIAKAEFLVRFPQ